MTAETGQPRASSGSVEVRTLVAPTRIESEQLAAIFDRHRAHYGEAADESQTASWLEKNISSGRLEAFVAEDNGELLGFAITMAVPASLRLGNPPIVIDASLAARSEAGRCRVLLKR